MPVPPLLPGGEICPPHVGQAEDVDIGVDARDHQITGEHRPIVPALVSTIWPPEVCSVQRVS